jgi:hypothetical protein
MKCATTTLGPVVPETMKHDNSTTRKQVMDIMVGVWKESKTYIDWTWLGRLTRAVLYRGPLAAD